MKKSLNNGKNRIETSADLMLWCNEVNSGNNKYMCDLQDIFTRSEQSVIRDLFLESDGQKELIIFAIGKAMGNEQQFRYMKSWARKQAEICIAENEAHLNERFEDLNKKSIELRDRELNIDAMIEKIDKLNTRISELDKTLAEVREAKWQLYIKTEEQETELQECYEIIEKNSEFEKRLKALIPIMAE